MSATVEPPRTIARADLPPMFHRTTPEVDALNLDYKLYFDCPDPQEPEQFQTLMVEWEDGLTLYFDRVGTTAMMHIVDVMGFSPNDVLTAIHDEPDQYKNVHVVIG